MSVTFPLFVPGKGRRKGHWLDRETFQTFWGVLYRTEIGAHRKYPNLPRTSIRRWWKKPCRYTNDCRCIAFLLIPPPIVMADPKVRVYLDSDLKEASENYTLAHAPEAPQAPGMGRGRDDDYVPIDDFREQLGVTRYFVEHWRDKDSKLRPGEKALRAYEGNAEDHTWVRTHQWVYRLGDGRAILRGEESDHPRVGRPCQARPGALTDEQARDIIRAAVASGPPTVQSVLTLARAEKISRPQLVRVLRELQIKVRGRRYYCLPGQQPPNPPAIQRAVEFYHETLADGEWHPWRELLKLAKRKNVHKQQLWEARSKAGVVAKRDRRAAGGQLSLKLLKGSNGQESPNGQAFQPSRPSATSATPKANPHANGGSEPRRRGRPSARKRWERWEREHQSMSLENIARKSGVTRRAVVKGLKELREARARELNSATE